MVTFGLTRFRLPIMPLFMLCAGAGAVTVWDRFQRRSRHAA